MANFNHLNTTIIRHGSRGAQQLGTFLWVLHDVTQWDFFDEIALATSMVELARARTKDKALFALLEGVAPET